MRKLYFAIPDYLQSSIEFIPERAGVLVVSSEINTHHRCKCVRDAQINPGAPKINAMERYQVARLGTMRIFSLKQTIIKHENEKKSLYDHLKRLEKNDLLQP